MTARTLARQYAVALFDVARRRDEVETVGREIAAFDALIASNDELQRVLASASVPASRKAAILEALIAAWGHLSQPVQRLLLLMAERNRLALFHDVAAAYAERAMDVHQTTRATITTAEPIDDRSREALAAALGKAVGRRVEITSEVDPSIIGGVIARVGGTVFDGSVTRQVERLRARLLADA